MERNRRVFEGRLVDIQQVTMSIIGFLCFWARAFKECQGVFFSQMMVRWRELMV